MSENPHLDRTDRNSLESVEGAGDETWTAEELAAFSDAEVQHGKEVAAELGIAVAILDSPSPDEFAMALKP